MWRAATGKQTGRERSWRQARKARAPPAGPAPASSGSPARRRATASRPETTPL